MLTRFWFRFANLEKPTALELGCGITARSLDDALHMLCDDVFEGRPFEIARMVVNVDVAKIADAHVLLAMGNPNARGVWFPRHPG